MSKSQIKSYFLTGKKPTQQQFHAFIDSSYRQKETITLLADGWDGNTYAFAHEYVIADTLVISGPDASDDDNLALYVAANIRGTTNELGIINYKCDNVPTEDINVNIMLS